MKPTLNTIRNYISSEVGYTKVGGSGCDKNDRIYGTSDDALIKLIYKKFINNEQF